MKKLFKTVATAFLMMGLVACSNEEASKKDEASLSDATEKLYSFLEIAKTKSLNDIKREPKVAK